MFCSCLHVLRREGMAWCGRSNSFALRTVPLGEARCRLELYDYFDMRGWFSTWISNKFHTGTFCQSLHRRLWRHLGAGRQLLPPVAASAS